MTSKAASQRTFILLISVIVALLSAMLLFGCAQSEPNAGAATSSSATPSSAGDKAEPAVAESSADDDTDGIYQLDVTPELEALGNADDVEAYIGTMRDEVETTASSFDHDDPDSVDAANDLLQKLANLNHYLPKLEEDGKISSEQAAQYSSEVDAMILKVDALVAS